MNSKTRLIEIKGDLKNVSVSELKEIQEELEKFQEHAGDIEYDEAPKRNQIFHVGNGETSITELIK